MERQDEYYEQDASFEEPEVEESSEESEIIDEEGQSEPISYEREEEVEEEDEEPKQRGRLSGNARIQQIQREKYQAFAELNRAREENEYLKRVALNLNDKANESSHAAMIHYDNSARLKLEQAKSRKLKAAEEGDAQGEVDADVDIATATNELQQISNWQYQKNIEDRNRQQQIYQQEQMLTQQQKFNEPDPQESYGWLERNSWFNPASHDFNPDLAQAARDYSEKVENYLYRQGRADLIMSREYYDEIDNYIHSLQSNKGQEMNRRQLNMRPARGGASPVRNTHASSQRREKHSLRPEEREMASLMGVKEKEYLSSKLSDQRDNPQYWNNGGRGNGRKGYY